MTRDSFGAKFILHSKICEGLRILSIDTIRISRSEDGIAEGVHFHIIPRTIEQVAVPRHSPHQTGGDTVAEKLPDKVMISLEQIEELVNTSGDQVVTGFYRRRRIRPCSGYRQAKRRAILQLSAPKGGILFDDGTCAVHIRFKWLIWLVPFSILAMIFMMSNITTKGIELPTKELASMIYPEAGSATQETSSNINLSIQVPGFSDLFFNQSNHRILLYNPKDNQCLMQYQIYIQEELVYQTILLEPEEREEGDFYQRLTTGEYQLTIIARGYSLDQNTVYNSVKQNIRLKVE